MAMARWGAKLASRPWPGGWAPGPGWGWQAKGRGCLAPRPARWPGWPGGRRAAGAQRMPPASGRRSPGAAKLLASGAKPPRPRQGLAAASLKPGCRPVRPDKHSGAVALGPPQGGPQAGGTQAWAHAISDKISDFSDFWLEIGCAHHLPQRGKGRPEWLKLPASNLRSNAMASRCDAPKPSGWRHPVAKARAGRWRRLPSRKPGAAADLGPAPP